MIENKQTPLVTVAIVTYNSAQYVRTAIESVLASSYTNFELIISDDCSRDNTWEIINSYSDTRIRASQNETNLREYPNRNKCIDLAKGDYFIFIDGDDYIYPDGLSKLIGGAVLNSEAAMIISRPESDHMIYPVVISPKNAFKYDYLGAGITSQGLPSTLFKTCYLKEHKLTTDFISGDTHIKKMLAYRYNTVLIAKEVAWWRRTPGQASEKLSTSLRGTLEHYQLATSFLNSFGKEFLTDDEFIRAEKRILNPFAKKVIKSFLKLKWFDGITILKGLKINTNLFKSLFYKHNNFYKMADSTNPVNSIYDK